MVRRYVPLKVPDLFRRFAAVRLSESGILDFARQYGVLLGPYAPFVRLAREDDLSTFYHGEELGLWLDQVRKMRIAVELLDLVAQGDVRALRDKIVWPASNQVEYRTGPDETGNLFSAVIASRHIEGQRVLPRFKPGEIVQPARFYLQRVVNDGMDDSVSPALLWDKRDRELNMFLVPRHLLGALWLQCARAVERGIDYRRCKSCKEWFRVGVGAAREDKRFCSVGCRVRWCRSAA